MQNLNKKAEDRTFTKGVLSAIPFAIKLLLIFILFIIVFFGSVYLIWLLLMNITESFVSLTSDINYFIALFINFVLSGAIFLGSVYFSIRFRYTYSAQKIITLKKYKQNFFSETIEYKNPKRFIFEYNLHSPDRSYEQLQSGEPDPEVIEFIKSKYPEFEYKQVWEKGSSIHNFIEALNVIDRVDIDEINEKLSLFNESLRLRIKNLDNGVILSRILEPTTGPRFWRKPLCIVTNKHETNLCDGARFQIAIEYKGHKGYDFYMRIK